MKSFFKYVLLYILITVLLLSALILVSFIPKEAIKKNIKRSAIQLKNEGEKVYFNSLGRDLFDDNSTDAIMLNLTYTIDEDNRLESIIKARRNFVPGVTEEIKSDEVGNLLYESRFFSMTKELLNTTKGMKQVSYEYARYWHGYIVILRILLCIFEINAIRYITQFSLLVLIIILMFYLFKNTNWKIAIGVFLAFVATDLFAWIYTLQGMFVMIIAVSISIFIANKKINEKNINVWLFISGALTAYLDFLTTPLVSVLLPIIVYTAVNNRENTLKDEIISLIKNLIAWGTGYFGIWAAKWIIADVLYNTDIIKISISQIYYRIFGATNNTGIGTDNFKSLKINVITSMNYLVIVLYVLLFIFAIIKKVRSHKKGVFISSEKLPYYLCIIITLAWYYIISEHSHRHYFFTYKTMVIPLISTMLIVLEDKKNEKMMEEGKKEIEND